MERDIYYKVSKEKLIELFAACVKLQALENGGIDKWEWYDFSLNDFLKDYGFNSFEECAKKEIENLPFVTVYHINDYDIALMTDDKNETNYNDFIIDMKEEMNELE